VDLDKSCGSSAHQPGRRHLGDRSGEGARRRRQRRHRGIPERQRATGTDGPASLPTHGVDRPTVRLIAEYSTLEEIAVLCAHLTTYDPRFAAVGRRAEDQQYARHTVLVDAGFRFPGPDERTAKFRGRIYQLPDVTAAVVRELFTPAALPPQDHLDELETLVANNVEEPTMPLTPTTDPNAKLNGPYPAVPEDDGLVAFVKRHCTIKNGVIAGAVVLLTTAVYLAVTRSPDVTA